MFFAYGSQVLYQTFSGKSSIKTHGSGTKGALWSGLLLHPSHCTLVKGKIDR